MSDKIILDVNITYNADEELKAKARDARGTSRRVNPTPDPTARARAQQAEEATYGGLTQLDKYVLGRDGVYVKRREKTSGFGVGWIQQEATEYIPEYVFCMGSKFTLWCGDGSRSLNFTLDHFYDTSRSGSEIILRVAYYNHDYLILPVKNDTYIVWIHSYAGDLSEQNLPNKDTLFLVNHTNIKQISKPILLEFFFLDKEEKRSGFVSYSFEKQLGSETKTLSTLYPRALRVFTVNRPTCGYITSSARSSFGFVPLENSESFGFDFYQTDHIVGTGYVYNSLLNRVMGDSTASPDTFAYLGMRSAPLRLKNYSPTSIWGRYPNCSESNLIIGSNNSGFFEAEFTPDFAYGYAAFPPQNAAQSSLSFEMEVANPTDNVKWWDNLRFDTLNFTVQEMDQLLWSPLQFSLPSNQSLNNEDVVWGIPVENTGFTDFTFPSTKTRFWQMLSNPWGRDWTAELIELGFSSAALTFEPDEPETPES